MRRSILRSMFAIKSKSKLRILIVGFVVASCLLGMWWKFDSTYGEKRIEVARIPDLRKNLQAVVTIVRAPMLAADVYEVRLRSIETGEFSEPIFVGQRVLRAASQEDYAEGPEVTWLTNEELQIKYNRARWVRTKSNATVDNRIIIIKIVHDLSPVHDKGREIE